MLHGNATQAQMPAQSYCDCLSSSSDPRVLRCTYCYPSIYSAPSVMPASWASTMRSCPAMISKFSSNKTGLINPNSRIDSRIFATWARLCNFGLFLYARMSDSFMFWIFRLFILTSTFGLINVEQKKELPTLGNIQCVEG